jgi:hypothetical protein
MDDVIGQRQWDKLTHGSARQCTATSKQSGERCRRTAIVGGFVCSHHGGGTPAVKKSARERLLALVDPALDALLRALKTGPPCEHCGRSDADRDPVVLRAAQLVLDRTGYHPTLAVAQAPQRNELEGLSIFEVADRAEAYARRARELANAEAARLLPEATATDAIDGFVVPEEDTDAAIQHPDVAIHDGNHTPGACRGDK